MRGGGLPPLVAHIRSPPAILYLCHTNRVPAAHASTDEDAHSLTRCKRSILVRSHRSDQQVYCSSLLQRCRLHDFYARTFRARAKIISPT